MGKKKPKNTLVLKVYKNKKNGQATVMLPKKEMSFIPSKVNISW